MNADNDSLTDTCLAPDSSRKSASVFCSDIVVEDALVVELKCVERSLQETSSRITWPPVWLICLKRPAWK